MESDLKLRQYQVDAFTDKVFGGNPAAVVPMQAWLDDGVMQAIASENNLSETAFFVPTSEGFDLRWFTPVAEVDLCGHATLATAHVIFNILGHEGKVITFATRSGDLHVEKQGDELEMDFPAIVAKPVACPEALVKGLGKRPLQVLAADDYLAVFESEADIRAITPDFTLVSQLDLRGVIITAPGADVDFVSRFFAPIVGVPEDPVTGSAHCSLAPYWAQELGKNSLKARQVSRRSGDIACMVKGERVSLRGSAVTFMEAEISF